MKVTESPSQGIRIKGMLAKLALTDPARFYSTFRAEAGIRYLRTMWDALGANLPVDAPVSADDVTLETCGEFLVLRLPVPTRKGEAFALAISGEVEGQVRVFLLELADAIAGSRVAAVVELDLEGKIACGLTTDVTTAGFIDHIRMVAAHPL